MKTRSENESEGCSAAGSSSRGHQNMCSAVREQWLNENRSNLKMNPGRKEGGRVASCSHREATVDLGVTRSDLRGL